MIVDIVKVIFPMILSFIVGMIITPYITDFLYKNKMWKKKAKSVAVDGGATPVFAKLHGKNEVSTPRLGGLVIWLSALIVGFLIWTLPRFFDVESFSRIEFISRNQTWIPFATFLIGALVGLADDLLEIKGNSQRLAGGLSLRIRIGVVSLMGLLISAWFYFKLDVASVNLPLFGEIFIGWLIIPLFTLIIIAIYAGGVIDGIDGLAGGIFAVMYSAYAVIAFAQEQFDLAAFATLIVGSIMAFLWFNIPPARFYMSETGSMALTTTLAVLAFMTDSISGGVGIFVLPIIALPLVITVISVLIQVLSKKYRSGKKILQIAPLHHHFEAIGWPSYKVTMRYWIFSMVCAAIGVIIALI